MPEWTIITNHGLVLAYISKHPRCTTRDIASVIKTTEWTVHKIISELEDAGYVQRQRVGRSNFYKINPFVSLRHESTRHVSLGDLLKVLTQDRYIQSKDEDVVFTKSASSIGTDPAIPTL